jgi:hypothetical protein
MFGPRVDNAKHPRPLSYPRIRNTAYHDPHSFGVSIDPRLHRLVLLARLSADEARITTAIDATRPGVVTVHHGQFTQLPHVLRHLGCPQ